MRALFFFLLMLAVVSGKLVKRSTLEEMQRKEVMYGRKGVVSIAGNGDPFINFRALQSIGVRGGCSCGCGGLPSDHQSMIVDDCETLPTCREYLATCRPGVTECLKGEEAVEGGCKSPSCRCCVKAGAGPVIKIEITGGHDGGFVDGVAGGGGSWSSVSNSSSSFSNSSSWEWNATFSNGSWSNSSSSWSNSSSGGGGGQWGIAWNGSWSNSSSWNSSWSDSSSWNSSWSNSSSWNSSWNNQSSWENNWNSSWSNGSQWNNSNAWNWTDTNSWNTSWVNETTWWAWGTSWSWQCKWEDGGEIICVTENGTSWKEEGTSDNAGCDIQSNCTAGGGSCYSNVVDCPNHHTTIEGGCGKDNCRCCVSEYEGEWGCQCHWSDGGEKVCKCEDGEEHVVPGDDNEKCLVYSKCTNASGHCYSDVTDCPLGKVVIDGGCGKDNCTCCAPSPCCDDCCYYNGKCMEDDTTWIDEDTCNLNYCINGGIQQMSLGSCKFRGICYRSGAYVLSDCAFLQCDDGVIVGTDKILKECNESRCMVVNDPHITGFHGEYYDWHRSGNFSLVQPGYTQEPDFGVYSKFENCPPIYSEQASCIGDTFIRDYTNDIFADPSNLSIVYINNKPYDLSETVIKPVGPPKGPDEVTIVYRLNANTIRIVGASGLLVEINTNWVNTWGLPRTVDSLHGLCTPYIDREGSSTNLTEFAPSWRTSEQGPQNTSRHRRSDDYVSMDLCLGVSNETKQKHTEKCTVVVEATAPAAVQKSRIEFCMKDMCVCNDQAECLKVVNSIATNDASIENNTVAEEELIPTTTQAPSSVASIAYTATAEVSTTTDSATTTVDDTITSTVDDATTTDVYETTETYETYTAEKQKVYSTLMTRITDLVATTIDDQEQDSTKSTADDYITTVTGTTPNDEF